MPLFRPYEPTKRTDDAERAPLRPATRGAQQTDAGVADDAAEPAAVAVDVDVEVDDAGLRTREKNRPTRSRKEAEAERRARARPSLSKKEANRRLAEQRRETRLTAMAKRDNTPEKQLLRNFFDSRWNLLEFLLPALILMLVGSLLASSVPALSNVSMIVMYGFFALALIDFVLAWRRFKKLLAIREPRAETRGLLFYGLNRAMQIRRMRMPAPVVKRGEKI